MFLFDVYIIVLAEPCRNYFFPYLLLLIYLCVYLFFLNT